ncbi:glycoside hydrolase family 43 protein [Sphingomonas koreensis]|nr:glycoside hydrolase family 43 protein [Sphingomonas koreensis]
MRCLAAMAVALAATANATTLPGARFEWAEYRGVAPGGATPAGAYRNPILAGFYSDPGILRVGDSFYLVNSTFSWFPSIPVFKSTDLVHWRQIGNAIDRPGQLDFTGLGMSRGVFAPAISYHDGLFYIADACVDCGGTFIVTARDPAGPWSDPVWLKTIDGIDPSLFFDDDGSVWMVNNRAPAEPPRYDGHRALWLQQIDSKTLQPKGDAHMIVDGGVDPAAKPVWIEGPHLFKRDGRYYLSAAEGGTSVNHSQVIFRSDSLNGPFRPAPPAINPILTQRDLDPGRRDPVTSAGHADLVRLADDSWWAVFLATEPYAGDLYNTGRETFLLPVTWRDGWPVILRHGQAVPRFVAAPALPRFTAAPMTGSFVARDAFDGTRLGPEWMMMRTPKQHWWHLGGGALTLDARPVGIGDQGQPSFIARRQQHADATLTTALVFAPQEGQAAGLAAVQDDASFLSIALIRTGGRTMIRAARRAGPDQPAAGVTIADAPVTIARGAPVYLRIHARGARYDLSYATSAGAWRMLARDVDGTNLSTAKAGGFTGAMIGMFAQR